MRSIQRNLTLSLVAGAFVLLVVAAVSIDRLLVSQLARDFDETLVSKAQLIAGLVERDGEIIEFDRASGFMPEFKSRKPLEYFALRLPDGRVFHKSPSLQSANLAESLEASNTPRLAHTQLPSGELGRMVTFAFSPRVENDFVAGEDVDESGDEALPEDFDPRSGALEVRDDEVIYHLREDELGSELLLSIVLARSTAGLEQLITASRAILGGTFAILVMGLALLSWFSVRRNFEPLRRLGAEVAALDENNLYLRVRQASNISELEPIARQLNHLLDRLERAFQREKRFSGDVAHELRTPISELRTMSEVGREWAGERELVEGFFGDLVNLANDMERTVSNLLALASLDAGNHRVEPESVELSRLVNEIWKRFGEAASNRCVSLDNRIPAGMTSVTDRDKLTMMLANIIANAVAYSPEGSTVDVRGGSGQPGDTLSINVSNMAPDLISEDLKFMVERFWRKDQSRTGGGHAGLGLSLVNELAQVLGIIIEFKLEEGARFTIALSGMTSAAGNRRESRTDHAGC